MRIRLVFASLMAGLLSACSPAKMLNATISSSGYRVEKNLAYGQDARQKLDLYIPENLKENAPFVVFFYGGSWQWGSKEDYLFAAQGLASLGYVVAVPDYRVYPQVQYPAFLHDCAQAVVWAHAHAADYGVSSDNLYLMGHSAGAYNAVMLSLNGAYLKQAGGDVKWVKGTVGLAGPYDFLPLTDPKLYDGVFASEKDLPKTQPITYVRKHAPRMLLLHGDADDLVGQRNADNLAPALRKLGNSVTTKEYHDVGHIGIVVGLNTRFPWNSQVREDVRAFIEQGQ